MKNILICVVLISFVFEGVQAGTLDTDDLIDWIEHNQNTLAEQMYERFQGLQDFVTANVAERLIHIEEMLHDVVQRQKMYHHCNGDVCGPHGECYVPEGTEESACECEEYWIGEHCNESNPCHAELYHMQFEPLLLGRETPLCDEEGFYAGMQYAGSMAICVTRTGDRLKYSVPRWETGDDMQCDCARDEYSHLKETDEFLPELFNCTEKGGYY